MKRLVAAASLVSLLQGPALAGSQTHVWDRDLDSRYWQDRPANAECPGPHFKSIWFKDHGHAVMRECVDTRTVIRLPNGESRARFVNVSYHGANSIVRGGKHYTVYDSKYKAVNCRTARWSTDSGYRVDNKGGGWYLPLAGSPGWFIFSKDGIPGNTPKRLRLRSTEYGHDMTFVTNADRFLCPKIQG